MTAATGNPAAMVKTPTPDSPSLVSIVWRGEWRTELAGKIAYFACQERRSSFPMLAEFGILGHIITYLHGNSRTEPAIS